MAPSFGVLSDLYQSIDDDFLTLQNFVDESKLAPAERLLFNELTGLAERLREESPTSIATLKNTCSELENLSLKYRRDGMQDSGLAEFLKYIPRVREQVSQIEQFHLEAGSIEEPSLPPVLVVESSDMIRNELNQDPPETFDLEYESDGIIALDKFIHKKYLAVIVSNELSGIGPLCLLKAMRVVDSPNKCEFMLVDNEAQEESMEECRILNPERELARNIGKNLRQIKSKFKNA